MSGNPAGKKVGVKNFKSVFTKVAAKKVPVTQPNGKMAKMTLLELLVSAVFTHAQNGKKAMKPIAAQLLESQFYEPAEKPPVLNRVMKCPDGVYVEVFVNEEVVDWINEIASGPMFPKEMQDVVAKAIAIEGGESG